MRGKGRFCFFVHLISLWFFAFPSREGVIGKSGLGLHDWRLDATGCFLTLLAQRERGWDKVRFVFDTRLWDLVHFRLGRDMFNPPLPGILRLPRSTPPNFGIIQDHHWTDLGFESGITLYCFFDPQWCVFVS